jgi:hypothetical protein
LPRSEAAFAALRRSRLVQLGFFFAAFTVATLLAKAFGARWGVASAFGQIAFVAAVFIVLMTDERPGG